MRLPKLSMKQRHNLEGYMFISPWIVGFLLFFLYPLVQSIILSFSKITKMAGFYMEWVGFENYMKAFVWDVQFLPKFYTTIRSTLTNTPVIMVFSLIMAIMLNKKMKFRGIFRGIFFLPVLLGSGYVLKQILGLNLEEGAMEMAKGIIAPKEILDYLGPTVSSVINGFLDMITLMLWKSGVQIVLFLAALQGITPSLYESSKCDGATWWEMFWKITLPMITPIILLNLIYTLIDSFTDANNLVMDYIDTVCFKTQQLEYGAAIGWIYFLFTFVLSMTIFLAIRNRTYSSTK